MKANLNKSFFRKFHFFSIIAILLIMISFAVYHFFSQKNIALNKHIQTSQEIIYHTKETMKVWLRQNRFLLKSLAENPDVIQAALNPTNYEYREKARKILTIHHNNMPYIMNIPLIAVLEPRQQFQVKDHHKQYKITNGTVFLDTIQGKAMGFDLSTLDYIKAILEGKDNYTGQPYLSLAIKKPIFVFSQAIKKDGKLRAILIMGVRLDYFTNIFVRPLHVGQKGYIVIIDNQQMLLSHPNENYIYNADIPKDYKRIIQRISGGELQFIDSIDLQPRYYYSEVFAEGNMENWFFAVSRLQSDVFAESYRGFKITFILLLIIAVFLVVAFLYFIQRYVEKPMKDYTDATAEAHENQFRAVFENSFSLIGLLDTKGTLLSANKTALSFLSLEDSKDILGKPLWETPWWNWNSTLSNKLRKAIDLCAKGQPIYFETEHPDAKGKVHIIEFSLRPIKNKYGKITLLVPEGRDITEQKESELKIKRLNTELEMKVIERTEQYEHANKQLQFTNQEMSLTNSELEKTIAELKETQTQLILSEKMSLLGQLIAGIAHEINSPLGAILSSNENNLIKINKILHTLPDFFSKISPEEKAMFFNLLDLSFKKNMTLNTQELRKMKKKLSGELEALNVSNSEAIAEFLADSGIFHHFEKCVPALKGENGLLLSENLYDLACLFHNTKIIETATFKAAKVIKALKNYSHNDEQEQVYPVELADNIETVLTLYQNKTKYNVDIIREFEKIEPIYANPDKLTQVWTNLINNALQAINFKGILTITIQDTQDFVIVSIGDNGPGIPEAIQPKIFTPFFTTKKKGEGSGLGLDISRKIIEEQGGKIDFTSKPGKTIFRVTLKKS